MEKNIVFKSVTKKAKAAAKKPRLYLAYGSNLNIGQMVRRCPGAQIVGVADLKGYRLMFKGSKTGAYATVEKDSNCTVPCGVWYTTEEDELMLDRYEGCPTFYYKKKITLPVHNVWTGRTTDEECYIYIMHEDRDFGIPSDRYVQTCLRGYSDFGFKRWAFSEAFYFTKEMVENG